ncbi:metallophosphoesterase [Paenibacillus sp. BK720]|uniref:metallophosphoesterase family protein n=1 Tax=Paenibacillus sp. BK720 TaxID=2587092 RepID=UPI001421E97C|nr:metallophosphoesterase [Paenibacillus sp. BK720]NIK67901.1 exonuclease SbcD [Paenibacillus sp. BK720]
MKFIFVGDPHVRGTNPRNRKDEYKQALFNKFLEIYDLAHEHDVEALILAGDTFDLPNVANSVLNDLADLLSESPVPIYTTAGNHDIPGYNIQAYANTSLRLLERIVPKLHVINDPADASYFGDRNEVVITFTPYSGKIDVDGYGYSPENELPPFHDHYRIHVAHGMLLDHEPPFDRFTLVQEVNTSADMVLTGHDHTGYGVYRRADGKIFCNPGSLTRLSASVSEIQRTVQVALITIDLENSEKYNRPAGDIQLIPLKSAKPGEEVLDRSRIEADQKRQYAMESFAALVQNSNGEKVLLDIPTIVDTIAEQNNIPAGVRELALAKIEEARLATL